ncbi:MAG: PQQ-binding-like beta-propeller repeat protein [Phycisphaerae bacterium]|nr:PQQ-binding-like beta-propeller repeat protein [Tepidisphaeraceae bacterium]
MTRALLALALFSLPAHADWPTSRGNAERTGAADATPGPVKTPKVLWTYESTDNFIAAPSPAGKLVFVPALGALQAGVVHALHADVVAPNRVAWSKTQPTIKLPTVSSPAVVGNRLYVGEGMHQNESPNLYCLDAETGKLVWALPVPGPLIHLEGTPTVAGGKVYVGGGNAGVICVDPDTLSLEGKEMDAAGVAAALAAKWKELQARYEADKKKDPDFAIPPSDDQLPKPAPKLVWQQGSHGQLKDKVWHVDSAIAIAGNNVLASSAYLDDEKMGDRALHCLDAATGAPKWRADLKHNPWAGPTVAGDVVLVGCSSIRFDPKLIPGAQGEVVAVNLADGRPKWTKTLTGGTVSPIAVVASKSLAIATTTDKKMVALNLADGADKWTYTAKAPFFGGAAVSGDLAYAADLNGVLHAVNVNDGKLAWRLDLGAATKAPGNVYGSPVVMNGRIYVGTCNLESAGAKSVVVCVGEK